MYGHGRDVLVLSTPSEYRREPQDIHAPRSHRWELQDPKGTPGIGGIVGSGCPLQGSSLPQGCPLSQSRSLCGPMSPASDQPLRRCLYSMRSKVSDSQDVETSRLSIHRATEKQNADPHCPKGTGAQYRPQRIGRPPKTSCSEQDSKGHRVCGPMSRECPQRADSDTAGSWLPETGGGRGLVGLLGGGRARDLVVAVDRLVKAPEPPNLPSTLAF